MDGRRLFGSLSFFLALGEDIQMGEENERTNEVWHV